MVLMMLAVAVVLSKAPLLMMTVVDGVQLLVLDGLGGDGGGG